MDRNGLITLYEPWVERKVLTRTQQKLFRIHKVVACVISMNTQMLIFIGDYNVATILVFFSSSNSEW